MSFKLYEETSVQDIANAIREKGGSGTYAIGEMGSAIRNLPAGGDQPQLYTPTIAIESDYLNISPNESNGDFNTGSTYYVYANGDLIATTQKTSLLLYDYITKAGDYTINVIQQREKFLNSESSNSIEWTWKGGLRFTNFGSWGTARIEIKISGTLDNSLSVYYMMNGDNNWVEWFSGTTGTSSYIFVPAGQYVEIWNEGETWSKDSSNYAQIVVDNEGQIKLSGYINSLLNGTTVKGKSYCFYQLFPATERIQDASELELPTLDLTGANYCYQLMFCALTRLEKVPAILPATTLAEGCYNNMFNNSVAFKTAPELPATTLAPQCYTGMFYNCTALTTAPELPATTLANNCYGFMFSGCTSLVEAPTIKATLSTAPYCYANMFNGCTSLTKPSGFSANSLSNRNWNGMYYGCSKLKIANSQVTKSWVLLGSIPQNVGTYGVTEMFYGCDIDSSTSWASTGTPDAKDWIYYLPQ